MHTSRRFLTASVGLLTALTLIACGGDDEADTAATTAEPAGTESTSVASTEAGGTDGTTAGSGGGEVGSQEEFVDATREEIGEDLGDLTDCAAEAIVSDDVYAEIEAAGLTLDEYREDGPVSLAATPELADGVGADLAACGDLLPTIFEGDQLSCAEGEMSNDDAGALIAYSLLGADLPDELQAKVDAVDACLEETTTTTT